MKYSRYNNYVGLSNGDVLGYNAFSRRFALLPHDIAQDLLNHTGAICQVSETFDSLVKAGFIIPDDKDEVSLLDKETIARDFDEGHAEVHVNPTLNCNFRCWYCYEEHQPKSEMSEEVFNSLQNYLLSVINSPIKSFHLGFFGGEPLLKFKKVCRPLIEWMASRCQEKDIDFSTNFTTNSYLLTQEMVDFLKQYNCCLQITLDGHREYHDKVRFPKVGIGSYDRILQNVVMASDAGIRVVLRINYTLDNIDSTLNIVDDLSAKKPEHPEKIMVDFQRVWQDKSNGGDEKVKETIGRCGQKLNDIGIGYSLPDLSNPRQSSCYGDKANYVCVNYNGDFFKCTARDFKPERRAGHLAPDGTLVWEPGRKEAWEKAKFSREVCRSCRIAPICLGGCRQRGLESPDDGSCPLGYDDARKDELILQRFEYQYLNT